MGSDRLKDLIFSHRLSGFDKTLNRDFHSRQIKRCRFLQMLEAYFAERPLQVFRPGIVLPCGAILIDGFYFLDQGVTPPAIRPSRLVEQ
jgi:hypothetical protein